MYGSDRPYNHEDFAISIAHREFAELVEKLVLFCRLQSIVGRFQEEICFSFSSPLNR